MIYIMTLCFDGDVKPYSLTRSPRIKIRTGTLIPSHNRNDCAGQVVIRGCLSCSVCRTRALQMVRLMHACLICTADLVIHSCRIGYVIEFMRGLFAIRSVGRPPPCLHRIVNTASSPTPRSNDHRSEIKERISTK